jgi:hypothetical protein
MISKINHAIHECLQSCYRSPMPLAALATRITQLRADPRWREAEIEEVETAVRHILRGVVRRDVDSAIPESWTNSLAQ